MNYVIPKKFDLTETLDCGQAFRWSETDGVWSGVAYGKLLKITEKNDTMIMSCTKEDYEKIWHNYFDLDCDYEKIKSELSSMNKILAEAAEFAPGIRILRQEPWEALCSFIFSQNNNIKRIKKIVASFCENFGENLGCAYTFPTAERVSQLTEEDLAPIKCGFRAKYILSAANMVANGEIDLNSLFTMNLDEARNELIRIKGVGPKVADCVLLYGFHRTECFPLDVWMKRAMNVLFPENTPEDFGVNSGIAQQYIFHYSRMNPHLFEEK